MTRQEAIDRLCTVYQSVGVHMGGAGLNAGHALFVGQLFAGVVDLLGQMGNAEQVHILKALGLPELCLFGEDELLRRGVEIHGDRQRLAILLATVDVKLALINGTEPVNGFLACHGHGAVCV